MTVRSPHETSRNEGRQPRLLVVGDVLLDRDVLGTVERLCPDAVAPVLDERTVIERPGGAGLVAGIAARAGAQVTLVCALAEDPAAKRLRSLLEDAGVHVVACVDSGSTAEKTRLRAGNQSLARVDRGASGVIGALPVAAEALVSEADAVVAADYGRRVLATDSVRGIVARAVRAGVPTLWDPHVRGAAPVRGLTLVVPNEREAAALSPTIVDAADEASATSSLAVSASRARCLRRIWQCHGVAVTLGERGAVVAIGDGVPLAVPLARATRSSDTCGAGDAFAVEAALCLANGAGVSGAVASAVASAAAFVQAGGASGLVDENSHAEEQGSESGRTVVAAGGCFDLLHAGHVAMLAAARSLGDRLVVLLNSDESVRRLKGPGRPVQGAADRAAVLRALRWVDEVIVFDEDTPLRALRRLQPNVFVKGGDYTAGVLPEDAVMREWGGMVVTTPYIAGRSTTGLIESVERSSHGR
ncbi:MAG: PfkB family carbohydrate kinase [Acidimicrobiia bacterium]